MNASEHPLRNRRERGLLLTDALPAFATELHQLLAEQGEPDLAAQVPKLSILERCRCGDGFCSTVYTKPKPDGAYGPGHRNDYVKETVTDDGRRLRQGFFVTKRAGEKFAAGNRAKGQLIKRGVPKRIVIEAMYIQKVTFALSLQALNKAQYEIALTAIAFKYGIPFALSPPFDALRKVCDAVDSKKLPVRIFTNANVQSAWLRTPHQHSVLCYLSAGMRKGWALVTLFGGLCYLVEVSGAYNERESKQFSILYEADTKILSNPILLADEMALIGHVLSPATTFEDPLAVDAPWHKVVAAFCSGSGTIVERLADRPPAKLRIRTSAFSTSGYCRISRCSLF